MIPRKRDLGDPCYHASHEAWVLFTGELYDDCAECWTDDFAARAGWRIADNGDLEAVDVRSVTPPWVYDPRDHVPKPVDPGRCRRIVHDDWGGPRQCAVTASYLREDLDTGTWYPVCGHHRPKGARRLTKAQLESLPRLLMTEENSDG